MLLYVQPGVLFHHETETKDWYFDLAIPWKHYVPIKWDLSNLRSAFLVAQSNQKRMQAISEEGTKLAKYILSPEYMDQVYDELFVDYLGKVVKSYQPPQDGGWPQMEQRYRDNGFELYNVGTCKTKTCELHCRKGKEVRVLFQHRAVTPEVERHASQDAYQQLNYGSSSLDATPPKSNNNNQQQQQPRLAHANKGRLQYQPKQQQQQQRQNAGGQNQGTPLNGNADGYATNNQEKKTQQDNPYYQQQPATSSGSTNNNNNNNHQKWGVAPEITGATLPGEDPDDAIAWR